MTILLKCFFHYVETKLVQFRDMKVVIWKPDSGVFDFQNKIFSWPQEIRKIRSYGCVDEDQGFLVMKKFWSTLVEQTCENFGWSEKIGQKRSFFHEALKVEGVFTCNRFVSMIRCPKHFGGTCFHPNSLMSSYLVNWWKKFFWNFDIFRFFDHFYIYFPY